MLFSATNFFGAVGGSNGYDLYADQYPPPFGVSKAIISDYNPTRGNPFYGHGTGDVFLHFGLPVNNFSFNILNFYYAYGQPAVYIDVFVNENYYTSFYPYGNINQGTIPITQLQSIHDITGIHIYNPYNVNQFGNWTPLYYDDLSFTPDLNVNITSARVSGSLNGTTKYALLGADIVLNAEITPSNSYTNGGSYAWSFTGPYSISGPTNTSSVTIRSTDIGILTAKVTYTKNGYVATGQVTIDARLPSIVDYHGTEHADQIAGPGHPCDASAEVYQLGCPAPFPPPSGMDVDATVLGPSPLISERSQSGVKLVQISDRYWKGVVDGTLMCEISTDQHPNNPYVLEDDPLPQAYQTFVDDRIVVTANIYKEEALNNDGFQLNDHFETYAVYYVSTTGNPSHPQLQVPLSKLVWNWGGLVAYEPNGFWNIREHYGPTGTYPVIGTPTSSMTTTHDGPPPQMASCSGATSTTYHVDGARPFVGLLYNQFFGHGPDEVGYNFWTSQITNCLFDLACRGTRRTDIAYAFFTSTEMMQIHPELANPPGTPGINSAYDTAFVLDCYLLLLDRNPYTTGDAAGLGWWVSQLQYIGYRQLVSEFINCVEFHQTWG